MNFHREKLDHHQCDFFPSSHQKKRGPATWITALKSSLACLWTHGKMGLEKKLLKDVVGMAPRLFW